MTTTTLFSNGRLGGYYRNLMKRNVGAMVYFALLGFVVFPLQFILEVYSQNYDQMLVGYVNEGGFYGGLSSIGLTHHTGVSITLFSIIMCVLPVVIGLVQFSYLHSKKAVDVYHSLPLSRDTLVLANLAAAFTTVMLPALANYLIVLAAGTIKSALNPIFLFSPAGLALDFLCWCVVVLTILAVVAFVSVQVGSVFDSFIFTCELILVVPAVLLLTLGLFEVLLTGFSTRMEGFGWMAYFSPVTVMIHRYTLLSWSESVWMNPELLKNGLAFLGWLLVALGLVWLSIRLYRVRRSEVAETSTSGGPLAQIGKFAAVYVLGSFIGMLFSVFNGGDNKMAFVGWTFVFSALVYILAEVILQRGFKGLRKSLVPGLISVGLVTGFAAVLATGGLGYESRQPIPSNVERVTVDYRGRYSDLPLLEAQSISVYEDSSMPGISTYRYNSSTDVALSTPEGIAAVMALHQAIIGYNADSDSEHYYAGTGVDLIYDLKSGKRMIRSYEASELGPAGREALLALENNAEFKQKTHPVFISEASDYAYFEVTDGFGLNTSGQVRSQTHMAALLEALRADMLEEELTRLKTQGDRAVCTISFQLASDPWLTPLEEDGYSRCYVEVYSSYSNTLSALRQAGLGEYGVEDVGKVTRMAVYPESWGRWYSGSVLTTVNLNQDNEVASWANSYDPLDVFSTTDPTVMRTLLKLSFTTRFLNRYDDTVSLVFFGEDGRVGGSMLLLPQDLPEAVLDALPQWVRERRYEQSMEYAEAHDLTVTAQAALG